MGTTETAGGGAGSASPGGPVPTEFIFVDESGDPGLAGNPVYILVGIDLEERVLERVRQHLTVFRYHNDVVRELKAQRWADKLSPPTRHLLDFLGDLTDAGDVVTTATWLDKAKYKAGKGPYLSKPGETWKFRHYQIRRLLELHRARTTWSAETDLVIDRWRMTLDQRADLEKYLRGNYSLRPRFASITTVASIYADPIQVADIYARLLRRVVGGAPSAEEVTLAGRLMDTHEIAGGLY